MKVASLAFLIFGFLLLGVGALFNILQFPGDMFQGLITGPIFLLIGAVLFAVNRIKNKPMG